MDFYGEKPLCGKSWMIKSCHPRDKTVYMPNGGGHVCDLSGVTDTTMEYLGETICRWGKFYIPVVLSTG